MKLRCISIALLLSAAVAQAGSGPLPVLGALPAAFEPNIGQTDSSVDYLFRGPGYTVFLTSGEVTVRASGSVWSMALAGSRVRGPGTGLEPQSGQSYYLKRPGAQDGNGGVQRFSRVRYTGVYAGVDVIYSATGRQQLEYDFTVAPGADPRCIELVFGNVQDLHVDASGALVFRTTAGIVRQPPPRIYQQLASGQRTVAGGYSIDGPRRVRFAVGKYDRTKPLVIDPVLSYSTEVGGSRIDAATALAVDSAGSMYVAGWTESTDFPAAHAVQSYSRGSVDAFVVKLSSDGASVCYATYLGGTRDDRAFGIAVDAAGSAIITGQTYSSDYPVVNALQGTAAGGRDAFVTKLSASGGEIVFSTYFGGSGSEAGRAVALDSQGNIYITGETDSFRFPTRNAYQAGPAGLQDAFIVKLTSAGALLYSTYIGGYGNDQGTAIAVDSAGNAYVTGSTDSLNFPAVQALQTKNAGGQDAFAAKLSASGDRLLYSTYLGGSGGTIGFPEAGNAIAVDRDGHAYVAGVTNSPNFPCAGALQPKLAGGMDAFVLKLNPTGTGLIYGTYLGGSGIDAATTMAVADSGAVVVAGYTMSIDFPIAGAFQTSNAGQYDAFVARLTPDGHALEFSSYLGGRDSDAPYGMAVNSGGDIYLAGQTLSQDFPLRGGGQRVSPDYYGAFVAKFSGAAPSVPAAVSVTAPASTGDPFVITFSDTAGAAALTWVQMLINSSLNGRNACWIQYYQPANLLMLGNDPGTAGQGAAAPGTAGTMQNSQCTVDLGGSSVARSGTNLILTVPITFRGTFAGSKGIYMAADDAGGSAGWQQKGTLVVSGAVPATGSFTSTTPGNLTFTFSDTGGYQSLTWVQALIHSSLTGAGACWVQYYVPGNLLMLVNDTGTAGQGAVAPGTPGMLQNSQCRIDAGASSVTHSGNTLTLNLSAAFGSGFNGTKNVYMAAQDAGQSTGWEQKGTCTIGVTGPLTVSASGTGSVITLTFSDTAGAAALTWVQALMQSSLTGAGACWVQYYRPGNLLMLVNDAGAAGQGAMVPGTAGSIQNSQCTLNVGASSVIASGNTLTLTLALTPSSNFTGVKNIYTAAQDTSGQSTGWQQKGTWTAGGSAPAVVAATRPSAGLYSFTFSDTAGAQALTWTQALIRASLSGAGACWIQYYQPGNVIMLVNDEGTAGQGALAPGAAGIIANSQCSINTSGASVSRSGVNLIVAVPVSFATGFAGPKNIYMAADNASGTGTGWQLQGSTTVP